MACLLPAGRPSRRCRGRYIPLAPDPRSLPWSRRTGPASRSGPACSGKGPACSPPRLPLPGSAVRLSGGDHPVSLAGISGVLFQEFIGSFLEIRLVVHQLFYLKLDEFQLIRPDSLVPQIIRVLKRSELPPGFVPLFGNHRTVRVILRLLRLPLLKSCVCFFLCQPSLLQEPPDRSPFCRIRPG